MGRFVAWKAWDDYLRAVALLSTDVKARFWLVGSGPEEARLKKLARLLKLEERVQFFPFAADVRPWLWASDLFVQTSKEPEGFSLMLIEAMAAGAVPLATNIGGTLDIVKDGENGLLFRPSDVKSLSALMMRAMNPASHKNVPQARNRERENPWKSIPRRMPLKIASSKCIWLQCACRRWARSSTTVYGPSVLY